MLKSFPYPLTCTAIQFGIGGLLACTMWLLRLHDRPVVTSDALRSISPLAGIHVVGNVLTNVSLRAVAVSFTHTVKALEPFFSVIMSMIFLGDQPSAAVVLSLIPIIGGVGLASVSELSFNWTGFLAALGSNITFQSRNVLSKKFMLKGGCTASPPAHTKNRNTTCDAQKHGIVCLQGCVGSDMPAISHPCCLWYSADSAALPLCWSLVACRQGRP